MAKIKDFQAKIYSLKKLPESLRTSFRLPQYPFLEGPGGPLPPDVRALFVEHQIIHYRDEFSRFGICCQPDDGDETPIRARTGFPAYHSQVLMVYSGMAVARWDRHANPKRYDKIVKKYGDDAAWMRWNDWTLVVSMDEETVRTG